VSTRKRRWSSEFKQAAVARMETAETIGGLASEPGIYRGLLFKWRGAFEAGGGAALRTAGRSPAAARLAETTAASVVTPEDLAAAQRRIEDLERKIGQQQLDLDFFRAALRHVRGQLPGKGTPGDTTSTR
jgi:transposase